MALIISPALATALKKAAGDKDVELFLAELVAERLDPPNRVKVYVELAERYLAEAEELYARGDLLQAGEKYWGAVAALLNAVAEKRRRPHYTHRDYAVLIDELYEETGDRELVVWFSMAERLHANFFMGKRQFDLHREAVLKLVEKLKALV